MTPEQQKEFYGETAVEWLKRWNEGRICWSISMGGLGPSYEQSIQMAMAAVLGHLVKNNVDPSKWDDEASWNADRDAMEEFLRNAPEGEPMSGASAGAALNLATHFYRDGPAEVLSKLEADDRKIQVMKFFPSGGRKPDETQAV